jgi:Cu/Ag efflux pump CusA
MIVLPVTIVVIVAILYAMFTFAKWALLILTNVAMAPFRTLVGVARHAYELQRFLRSWLSRTLRSVRTDRCHHG